MALVAAVALGIWTYYRLRAPLKPGWVVFLRILRTVAFLLVLFPLLEPVLSLVGNTSGSAPLLVLIDSSGSMGLPAKTDPASADSTTRLQASHRLLDDVDAALGSGFDLQFASFSGRLQMHADRDSLPARPQGPSAVGEALEQSLTAPGPGSLSGIVLVSDGVNTTGKDPVAVARNSPVPIYTVCLGDTLPPDDLLIRQVQTNTEVTLGEPLPMQVTLEAWGRKGHAVEVEVLDGAEIVASKKVTLRGGGGEAQDVRLDVRPRRPGLVLYRVRARLEGRDDPLPSNNERLVAVEVREKARRILVIDPNPSWDFTFLKRTLQADSSLVSTFLIKDLAGRWKILGDPVVSGWPQGSGQWRHFSAVILGGAKGVASHAQDIKRFAEEGGGVFFLHGAGGWRDLAVGPLSGLLPVNLSGRRARQGPPLAVDLTEAGQVDPLTLVSDSPYRNATLWAGLPPIWPGPYRMVPKPGARVLLSWKSEGAEPAFTVASFGKGRVAALCGYGFWRWIFLPRSLPGATEVAEPFFRQVVHWLMEPSTQDRFRVVAVRKVFQNGDAVDFEGRYRDPSYEPLPGARTELRIASDDGLINRTAQMIPSAREGEYQGHFEPLPPGAYSFEAQITAPGGERETREGRFWVEATGAETFRTWSDPRTLRMVAEVSGGGIGDPGDLSDLRSLVQETHRRSRQVRQAELWNHWILFAAFVALLGTEWFIRRRRGLA